MSTFFNNFFGVKFLVEKAINAIYVARQQYFAFRLGRLCKQIAYLHSVPLLLFRLWCGKIKIETSVFFAILAVCFQRSAFRAHFSPREIGCLPTAMTFARKIRRYCFGVSFLPVSPLGGMVLRMGRGVTRFSYRVLHRGDAAAILIGSDLWCDAAAMLIRSDVQSDFA